MSGAAISVHLQGVGSGNVEPDRAQGGRHERHGADHDEQQERASPHHRIGDAYARRQTESDGSSMNGAPVVPADRIVQVNSRRNSGPMSGLQPPRGGVNCSLGGPYAFDPEGLLSAAASMTITLARIMREGVDSGRDTRASVWYKRSVHKRLATTEAPA